jgi:hypothetical protein
MQVGQDIFRKITEKKEKHREKANENLRDRARRESNDTFNFIERQRMRGKSDREIMRDLDKSHYKNQGQ